MRLHDFNWDEIQRYYDSDCYTWKDLVEKFKLNTCLISSAAKAGLFKSRNNQDSRRLREDKRPKFKHTAESKKKISEARKKYLAENPDKVPYILYHVHKNKFYSEEYFLECLPETIFKPQVRVGPYSLDFADLDRKIDLEIDGFQHFNHQPIIEHDKRRNAFLLDLGFTIIRIRWAEFKKLTEEQRKFVVNSIIANENPGLNCVLYLTPTNPSSIYEEYIESKKVSILCDCGKPKHKKSKTCRTCCPRKRKVEWPSKEVLFDLLDQNSYESVGRMFKVSGAAVRKWVKYYNNH